ncbi:MAG: Cof-type HAD-IIB family hydrolase [Clostridium sp.]|uniref:Cof-type HAD-IIB family hydrolase n=1 Tax=Clostridium sp. TaxID=1506 RepID=UPI003EE56D30
MELFKGILLATDMDGTLLDDEKKISKRDLQSIKYFEENGGIFTIATGRSVDSARPYVEQIGINFPVATCCGSKIYDYRENKVVEEYFLNKERKEVVYKILEDKLPLAVEVYVEEKIYMMKLNEYSKRAAIKPCTKIYDIPDNLMEMEWSKILLAGDPKYIDKLEKEFLNYGVGAGTRTGKIFLEILPLGTSKLNGIKIMMREENIEDYKVVVLGDDMNDLEMIEGADIGIVMANANKNLLAKVENIETVVIGTNNNNDPLTHVVKMLEKELVYN